MEVVKERPTMFSRIMGVNELQTNDIVNRNTTLFVGKNPKLRGGKELPSHSVNPLNLAHGHDNGW